MNTVIIIAADGYGKRCNMDIPKQYVKIASISLIVYTLKKFSKNNLINGIILAVPKQDINFFHDEIINKYNLAGILEVLPGG